MQERTLNLLFALIVGKSIKGSHNGKYALSNMWDNMPCITYCVNLIMDSRKHRQLLEAVAGRTKPRKVSE